MAGSLQFEAKAEVAARFPDLHPAFPSRAAVVEAHRCLNCFDAPCMGACPTHIDVPGFIKRIASGNLRGAAVKILEANVMAASCARVCPVEVLCEGACVMHGRGEKAIEIGRLQRFAMEEFHAAGEAIPMRSRPERKQRVVCIGAGPASLACAAELRQRGFQVSVLDRRAMPGGLNTYGVAEYKLRAADSTAEIEMIRAMGVEFRRNEVVDAASLEGLESEFDAVFLGVGLGAMHSLALPGGDSPAIIDALEFIARYKTGEPVETCRRVVVIGAGNTAVDAAVAARRLGAKGVTILYRRGRADVSAFGFEIEHALTEGVEFEWDALPVAVRSSDGSTIVECVRVVADAAGVLLPVKGSEFALACDLVIPAIGQAPLLDLLERLRGVTVASGRVLIDRGTGQTSNAKYFAGGDCVNGGREVVDAVADGKRAAIGIAEWLDTRRGASPVAVEVAHG